MVSRSGSTGSPQTEKVEAEFAIKKSAKRYADLYKELLEKV